MGDVFPPDKRREVMSRIRSRGTKPELEVMMGRCVRRCSVTGCEGEAKACFMGFYACEEHEPMLLELADKVHRLYVAYDLLSKAKDEGEREVLKKALGLR